jgi:2-isopropylmalate synthase
MVLKQKTLLFLLRIKSVLHKSWMVLASTISKGMARLKSKGPSVFKEIRSTPLSQAKIAAFGSTCRAGTPPQQDPNIQALIEAGTEVVTIFGKSWDIHPLEALNITLDQNLEIIQSSIRFLKDRVGEVIFDAEHFFDGYKNNPQYALSTLKVAQEAKADWIVLCDTNGGTFHSRIHPEEVKRNCCPLVSVHNDTDMAVANSILTVKEGVQMVHGTINGLGSDAECYLCSIIQISAKMEMIVSQRTVEKDHRSFSFRLRVS